MNNTPLFAGHYEIQAEGGRGPTTTVYRAVDEESGETVALKRFPPAFTDDPRFVLRFRDHLRRVAVLDHPSLLPILDYGLADGEFYIAEAWADGLNLNTYLDTYGPLPPPLAVAITRRICAAVAAVHEQGLLHRDLKPENIFLQYNGEVGVADVGFGALVSESGLSRTDVMLGGIAYLSPEQARGEQPVPASDVYSTGVLLFEMLTGSPPFTSDDLWSVVSMHAEVEPPRADELNPAIPGGLAAIVAQALAKDPAERYSTIEAFDEALGAQLHHEQFVFPATPQPEEQADRAPLALLSRRLSAFPPDTLARLLLIYFLATLVVAFIILSLLPTR